MNCILFVIVLDSCCISKTLSRVYKGQTGFKLIGVFVFEFLGSSFSSASFSIGASFSRLRCFVLRSSFSSASFSKLPKMKVVFVTGSLTILTLKLFNSLMF